jgi:hypothetical protein
MLESGTSAGGLAVQPGRSASLRHNCTRGRCCRRRSWPVRRPAPRPGSPPGSSAIGETSTHCTDSPSPHHVVDADDVSQANSDGVLLKAQHDVAAEEVAREHAVFEPGQWKAGMTLEDAAEDQIAQRQRRIERLDRASAGVAQHLVAGAADLALPSRAAVCRSWPDTDHSRPVRKQQPEHRHITLAATRSQITRPR